MKKSISYNVFIRNTIILFLFFIYGTYIQSSNIEKSIKNDAGVIANLVFQNLYTVMKNGGTKESLDSVVTDLEKSMPDISIRVLKPYSANKKDIVKDVFKSKEAQIVTNSEYVDFASPILFSNKCLVCHTDKYSGDVAATILIEYPILNLQISLRDIINMASILFLITIVVFFFIWYIFLKKYFVKPINSLITQMNSISTHEDLQRKVYIDTSIREVKQLEESFNQQNDELINSYNNLETISNTDSLTGVYNRKKFDEYTALIIKNAKRYNHNLTLIVMDLNKFKQINDTCGHQAGDDILVLFTSLVKSSIRESDYLFRTGGDEFVLLLPETSAIEAVNIVNKITIKFDENIYQKKELRIKISASFGIAQYGEDGEDIVSIMSIADDRMYKDKENRR